MFRNILIVLAIILVIGLIASFIVTRDGQRTTPDGSGEIQIGDKTKHIMGYLQDFLFTPERARTEVRFLSGGERNRARKSERR